LRLWATARDEVEAWAEGAALGWVIRQLVRADLPRLVGWDYSAPYEMYSVSEDGFAQVLDPALLYFTVSDDKGAIVGYCCFGQDAQVPGGRYVGDVPSVVDIGFGLAPALTGSGLGAPFLRAVMSFAAETFDVRRFRATIAEFNQRSLRTFVKRGFEITHRFERQEDGLPFVQVERIARPG
jgi:RimJ/RimL family protein N-acetyltransferase